MTTIDVGETREATAYPFRRILPALVRDPLRGFEEIARDCGGEIARLNLGTFRPYLVTRPEHAQHVLRDNAANYRREGLMWKPLSRLVGQPSGADPAWPVKRSVFQALLSGRTVKAYTDTMGALITAAVDDLGRRSGIGEPIDAGVELARIVNRAVLRIFMGDKLAISTLDELGQATAIATGSSFRARMLFPFVPHSIPLPGDRAFHRAVDTVDDILRPIVRSARRAGADGDDIVSRLLRAQDANGNRLDDQQVRDATVGLFVAGTETTANALTFLWVALESHPGVAERLESEIDRVVGTAQPGLAHVEELQYTKMVMQELLRICSIVWILPRSVVADDVVGGVRIPGGSTVIVSPYLTHRLEDVWPNPEVFDPARFSPDNVRSRHRYAYLPFGAGPHQCVGSFFFTVEATLIAAAMISRLRPKLHTATRVRPRVGLTLRPHPPVDLMLRPTLR